MPKPKENSASGGRKPSDQAADAPLRGMRDNGAASAAELREFLTRMRGKPPQEVLGLIAQSSLARAMFLATLLTIATLAVGTALPFASKQWFGDGKQAAAKASPDKRPAKTAEPVKTDATAEAKSPRPVDPKEAALSKLGVGDTKTSPKNVNPLENRADDILKDFDKK